MILSEPHHHAPPLPVCWPSPHKKTLIRDKHVNYVTNLSICIPYQHWFYIDWITSHYNTDSMITKERVAIPIICKTLKVEFRVRSMLNESWARCWDSTQRLVNPGGYVSILDSTWDTRHLHFRRSLSIKNRDKDTEFVLNLPDEWGVGWA